jgi:predicted CoA-binding protein
MPRVTERTLEDCFTTKRIAVIGASRNPKNYGRRLMACTEAC